MKQIKNYIDYVFRFVFWLLTINEINELKINENIFYMQINIFI